MSPVIIPPPASRVQLGWNAQGLIVENFHPHSSVTAVAPATQSLYGVLLGLRAGDSVTGVALRVQAAAAGTAPTLGRFGIADSTGKILAISGDVGAAANWVLGISVFPLAAPYTVLTDGAYYACFVVNGTWGTTQPTAFRGSNQTGSSTGLIGANARNGFRWTSQTDLPAVNSSMTITGAADVTYYMAFYGTAVT